MGERASKDLQWVPPQSPPETIGRASQTQGSLRGPADREGVPMPMCLCKSIWCLCVHSCQCAHVHTCAGMCIQVCVCKLVFVCACI